jgi:predicted outer membrane protein
VRRSDFQGFLRVLSDSRPSVARLSAQWPALGRGPPTTELWLSQLPQPGRRSVLNCAGNASPGQPLPRRTEVGVQLRSPANSPDRRPPAGHLAIGGAGERLWLAVLPDTTPLLRTTMVLAAFTGLAVAVLAWLAVPAPRIHLAVAGGWTQTPAGPVGPTDRALLVALRQDGLWEVPVGQQAQDMATSPAVRQLGGTVATDLGWLSGQVRAVAGRLDVVLPSQPTPDQQTWLVEIAGKSGRDYDQTMVDRLRQACSDSLKLINKAAAGTHNTEIRQLADRAAGLVGRHIQEMDGIERVADKAALGAAGTPSVQPTGTAASRADEGSAAAQVRLPGPDRTMVTLAVLVVLSGAIAAIGIARVVRIGLGGRSGPPDQLRLAGRLRRSQGRSRELGRPVWLRRPARLRRTVVPPPPVVLGSRGDRRPW